MKDARSISSSALEDGAGEVVAGEDARPRTLGAQEDL